MATTIDHPFFLNNFFLWKRNPSEIDRHVPIEYMHINIQVASIVHCFISLNVSLWQEQLKEKLQKYQSENRKLSFQLKETEESKHTTVSSLNPAQLGTDLIDHYNLKLHIVHTHIYIYVMYSTVYFLYWGV